MMRQTYLDNFRRHRKEWEDACRALKAEAVTFETQTPLIDSLTGFLRRRSNG